VTLELSNDRGQIFGSRLLSYDGGKLSAKFSYVIIIYQVSNNDNTLNVLFTSCVINVLLFFDQLKIIMFKHVHFNFKLLFFNVLKNI
jgi:hypothetical protein